MHVLVTGGAGYIGSHVTRALLVHGHRVTVIDDLSNGHADAVPPEARLGVLDVGSIPRGTTVDVVIHLAGQIGVGDSPREHWSNNVGSTLKMLERVRTGRVVFASSAAVYGDAADQAISIREDTPLRPLGSYGQTKVAVEQMLEAFSVDYTTLRLFNVAGGRERHKNETHLLPLALRGAVTIFGSDAQLRDYVHVEDVADAFVRAIDGPVDVYNIGRGVATSVRELLDTVEKITGHPVAAFRGLPRPGDPQALVANIDRARLSLGWTPRRTLEEIVRSASVDTG